ncbi:MAG TPA: hypothetical protein VHD61_09945 [Lacunisphaera sp.]|nr:hypothetical protein [Lacunisphaera sp.]
MSSFGNDIPSSRCHQRRRGSLILLVMCLLAVLGIALASYLAVANNSMKLGQRNYAMTLSRHLAEIGLEEALRAFNNNNFSTWTANSTTATWSDNGTGGKKCTITPPSTKYGTTGVTGTVKIRFDNYNVTQLNSSWSSSANYLPGNLVGYTDGTWYRCISSHSNKAPSATNSNSSYWIQEESPISSASTWISGTAYVLGNMVLRNGNWYRCKTVHTSSSASAPPNTTYWIYVSAITADADLRYTTESTVRYYLPTYGNDAWYRWNTSTSGWDVITTTGTWQWYLTWHWSSTTTYGVGDFVNVNNVWYRSKAAGNLNHVPPNATYWDTSASLATTAAASWAWSSSTTYNLGDVVYYSSQWYRSLSAANTNNTPSGTSTYWSTSPVLSPNWDSGRQYSANDVVYYNGVWYWSRTGTNNIGQNPATTSGYWYSTANASTQWNAATSYSVGNYRSYGGVWYKCLAAGSSKTPNNSSNWTNNWSQGSGVSTGAPVIYAEGQATLPDGTSTIKTQLRATVGPSSLFPNAIAGISNVTINGAGTVDSYDSITDPTASTPGYAAVIAGGSTSGTAVTVTGTTVNGYVSAPGSPTSPYAPLWSYGGSAVLRGTSSGTGIDLTRVSRSPSIPQFDIRTVSGGTALAASTGWAVGGLTLGTAGATTPTYYTYSGNLNMNDNSREILKIVGPVVLDVQGNLHIQSYAANRITIAETGSLELHVSGRLILDSDGGGIDNQTKDPKKCVLLCTSTSTLQNLSYGPSSQPFYGVIYMPNGTLTVDSGVYIFGAVSAKNVTFTSEANLHYDTSLRYAVIPGVDQPWAISEWREITDSSELANMP